MRHAHRLLSSALGEAARRGLVVKSIAAKGAAAQNEAGAGHELDPGCAMWCASKRLGHASPAVTLEVYAHMFSQREDKSAEAINEAVAALLWVC